MTYQRYAKSPVVSEDHVGAGEKGNTINENQFIKTLRIYWSLIFFEVLFPLSTLF